MTFSKLWYIFLAYASYFLASSVLLNCSPLPGTAYCISSQNSKSVIMWQFVPCEVSCGVSSQMVQLLA